MIRILRGQEPARLRATREWRLARALIAWHERSGRPWTDAERESRFRKGYTTERETLWSAQHGKCAYCEIGINEGEDIEHFRPINLYWWLTWSWDNHFVVCGQCSGGKGHDFPLTDDADRLVAPLMPDLPRVPPEAEAPCWIDPAREDPRDAIRFRKHDRGFGLRWEPIGVDADGRGEDTILGLETYRAMDHVNKIHLRNVEDPELDLAAVRRAARDGKVDRDAWRRVVRRHLALPTAPFRSLMHDYLETVRADLHRDHSVELPPLPDITDPAPAPPSTPLFAPDPTLDQLPTLDALYVRSARGGWVPHAHRHRALRALFDHRPTWPLDALRAVFPGREAKLDTWIRDAPDLRLHDGAVTRTPTP